MNPLGSPVPQMMAPQDPWTPPPMTPQNNVAPAFRVTMPADDKGQQGPGFLAQIVQALRYGTPQQQLAQPWNQVGNTGNPTDPWGTNGSQ
jgi:hypothetical protein